GPTLIVEGVVDNVESRIRISRSFFNIRQHTRVASVCPLLDDITDEIDGSAVRKIRFVTAVAVFRAQVVADYLVYLGTAFQRVPFTCVDRLIVSENEFAHRADINVMRAQRGAVTISLKNGAF